MELLGSGLDLVLRAPESSPVLSWLFDLAGFSRSLLTFCFLPVIVVEGTGC